MNTRTAWMALLLAGLLSLAACGSGGGDSFLKSVEITEDNQEQVYNDLISNNALSAEEYELLQAYIARQDLPRGQKLPTGMTVAEMIEAQREYAGGAQAEGEEAPAGEEGSAEPAGGDEPRGIDAARRDTSAERSQREEPRREQPREEPREETPPATATLDADSEIVIRLEQSVSSERSSSGESFEASLAEDLTAGGKLLAERGSRVTGRVTHAKPSGKVKGKAELSITLDRIYAGDNEYPLNTNTLRFQAEGSKKEDAKKIGIGAAIGTAVGAIAGGGKGAAIGAAIGAGAGTGAVLMTKGKTIDFPVEQKFAFKLDRDLEMQVIPQ